jgi:hypothetical protein
MQNITGFRCNFKNLIYKISWGLAAGPRGKELNWGYPTEPPM